MGSVCGVREGSGCVGSVSGVREGSECVWCEGRE